MAFDLKSEIALFEKDGIAIATENCVTQAGFQAVPSGRQRSGEITNVFVIHAKHGAEASRFRDTIAAALSRDIPVLIGLSRLNQDAFHEFTDGMATKLEPSAATPR